MPPAPLELGSGIGSFSAGETSPTVRTDCSSNSLILRLYDEQMKRVKEAIETQLDLLPPQVKIESRLELLDRTDLFALGVQWGGGGLLGINDRTAIVGRGFTSNQTNTLGIPTANTGSQPIPNAALANVIPVSGTTGLAAGGNLVNLPIASLLEGAAAGGGGGFAFGIIGSRMDLNLALEALRVQNRSQSLARPEVVVAENQAASISIGEEIPYATISAAGTQVQFKNALLRLEVSPVVICRDEPLAGTRSGGTHRIRLQVLVENATRGAIVDLGAQLGQPAGDQHPEGGDGHGGERGTASRHRRDHPAQHARPDTQGAAPGRHPSPRLALQAEGHGRPEARAGDLPDAHRAGAGGAPPVAALPCSNPDRGQGQLRSLPVRPPGNRRR